MTMTEDDFHDDFSRSINIDRFNEPSENNAASFVSDVANDNAHNL